MTAFVRHGDLERAVVIVPGHEYLVKDGQDYGIATDKWLFVLRSSDAVALLNVGTCAVIGRLLETPAEKKAWHEDYAIRYGYAGTPPWALRASLEFCTSFPTDVSSIRKATKPTRCDFQVSAEHYPFGDGTSLGADPLIIDLDRLFMEGPPAWWLLGPDEVQRHLLEDDLGVWPKLDAWFRAERSAADRAYAALPVRCTHCDGTGVLPPTSEY